MYPTANLTYAAYVGVSHFDYVYRGRRGRKQYRYHAAWRAVHDDDKFGRMFEFGRDMRSTCYASGTNCTLHRHRPSTHDLADFARRESVEPAAGGTSSVNSELGPIAAMTAHRQQEEQMVFDDTAERGQYWTFEVDVAEGRTAPHHSASRSHVRARHGRVPTRPDRGAPYVPFVTAGYRRQLARYACHYHRKGGCHPR